MFKTINAVLWDLDGTLINSEPLQDLAVVYATNQIGKSVTLDDIPKGGGLDNLTIFRMLFAPHKEEIDEDLFNYWQNLTLDYIKHNFAKLVPIHQSIELVHEFKQMGLIQSIVSNSSSQFIIQCAETLGINHCMSHMIGRDQVLYGKPDPDLYLEGLWLNDIEAANCLVFEDSTPGIIAAANAKINNIIGIGQHESIKHLIKHSCSLNQESWLKDIKDKFFS